MKSHLQVMLCGFLAVAGLQQAPAVETETEAKNKVAVQAAFDAWRAGTGGPFALLAPDATWTITGNSLAAKKYNTRDEFLDKVIKPFNARLTKPLVPTIHSLHSDGDTVIALFDGEATALDGKPYRNTYAWFMEMRDGKIVRDRLLRLDHLRRILEACATEGEPINTAKPIHHVSENPPLAGEDQTLRDR
jgi:ketosteroid isomerase-like protein